MGLIAARLVYHSFLVDRSIAKLNQLTAQNIACLHSEVMAPILSSKLLVMLLVIL
jgi:hypothetical protein